MDFKDLYSYVFKKIEERDYANKSAEEKKLIIDDIFKQYMNCAFCRLNALENIIDIDTVDVVTLFTRLSNAIHPEVHSKTINYFNLLMVSLISLEQGYQLVWFEEDEECYIDNPMVIEKDDLVDVFVTNKDTNYLNSFSILYNHFVNKVLKIKNNEKRLIKNIID